jgi:two-component system, cell cycle response regulator
MTQNVLLVEDDDMCALLVESQLRRHQEDPYEIVRVSTLREALAHVHNAQVDLILLDLGLPDSTGLHSVTRLKETAPNVPIVVLTANEDEDLPLESVRHGAQEYLSKDMVVGKLLSRAIKLSVARQKQLARAQAEALIDPLTGLANRRAFDLELRRLETHCQRFPTSYCVVMIDIDHFKQVNDTWGHEVGDAAINQVARVLESFCGPNDIVSRYGGEEFGMVLPDTMLEQAVTRLERLGQTIATTSCHIGPARFNITVSMGVASLESTAPQNLLNEADQALYLAKAAGRNRIRTTAQSACASAMA